MDREFILILPRAEEGRGMEVLMGLDSMGGSLLMDFSE